MDLQKRLSDIEERLEKATPGPWRASTARAMGEVWANFYAGDKRLLDMRNDRVGEPDVSPDETLIAHAPEDLRLLLTLVKEYRAALEDIAKHAPESVDKVALLLNIDGYRDRARQALARGEGMG